MPRANRYALPGQVCHVTHRCHDRAFLWQFARDRDAYRTRRREGLQAFGVHLLNYTVTSNHVHLLTVSDEPEALSRMMQKVAGGLDQAFAGTCSASRSGRRVWLRLILGHEKRL